MGHGLAPIDRWSLSYLAFATLALALRRYPGLPTTLGVGLAHLLFLLVVALAPRARRAGALGGFLGEFYPLLLVIALYTEIGLLNAAAGVAHDACVQGWEAALFAGQPSRDWIRSVPWPNLSIFLHVAYLSFYFVLAVAPFGLWFSGRRRAARETLLLIMVAFYICYAISLCFPVAGPRYAFPKARNAATATAPAMFAQRLLDHGAAWGTAFPSSHVAVSLVASLCTLRSWTRLGAVLLPVSLFLCAGTVYGQFHYAVDVLAGALVAAGVLLSRSRLVKHVQPGSGFRV